MARLSYSYATCTGNSSHTFPEAAAHPGGDGSVSMKLAVRHVNTLAGIPFTDALACGSERPPVYIGVV